LPFIRPLCYNAGVTNGEEVRTMELQIAVISDTHGLLRPELVEVLKTCDHIIHAGDVGDRKTLDALREIAPVTAVRGNVDAGRWAEELSPWEAVELGGRRFYVIHDLHRLDLDPEAAGFDVVIFGHSHAPEVRKEGSVFFINPGSAGPKRFHFPVSYVRVDIVDDKLALEFKVIDFELAV